MKSTEPLPQEAGKSIKKLSRQSRIYKIILQALQERKAEKLKVLDLRNINEAVADFFVIAEATTSTQVKAIADKIQDLVLEQCSERPHRTEGYQYAKWVLVDYINIVVHVMQPETRAFYNLEEMWHDAPMLEIETD